MSQKEGVQLNWPSSQFLVSGSRAVTKAAPVHGYQADLGCHHFKVGIGREIRDGDKDHGFRYHTVVYVPEHLRLAAILGGLHRLVCLLLRGAAPLLTSGS